MNAAEIKGTISALEQPLYDSSGESSDAPERAIDLIKHIMGRVDELQLQLARFEEALTPSADTKAAYTDEVSFPNIWTDEDGVEHTDRLYVPWTCIKQIMAMISKVGMLDQLPDITPLRLERWQ